MTTPRFGDPDDEMMARGVPPRPPTVGDLPEIAPPAPISAPAPVGGDYGPDPMMESRPMDPMMDGDLGGFGQDRDPDDLSDFGGMSRTIDDDYSELAGFGGSPQTMDQELADFGVHMEPDDMGMGMDAGMGHGKNPMDMSDEEALAGFGVHNEPDELVADVGMAAMPSNAVPMDSDEAALADFGVHNEPDENPFDVGPEFVAREQAANDAFSDILMESDLPNQRSAFDIGAMDTPESTPLGLSDAINDYKAADARDKMNDRSMKNMEYRGMSQEPTYGARGGRGRMY